MKEGETSVSLAKELGVTSSLIRKKLRDAGYSPRAIFDSRRSIEKEVVVVYTIIQAGGTYRQVCQKLGIEYSDNTLRRLRIGMIRYCERLRIPVPAKKRGKPNTVWQRSLSERRSKCHEMNSD